MYIPLPRPVSVVLAFMCAWTFIQDDAKAAAIIPLCPGLQIVTAVSQAAGDYESIKTIQTISNVEIRMRYSAEVKEGDIFSVEPPKLKTFNLERIILVKDLQSATDLQQTYLDTSATKIPGTTSIGTSAAVLQKLKTKGKTEFGYSVASGPGVLTADRSKYPNYYSALMRGTLKRIAGPATLSVIVNDTLTDLPVIRAKGDYYGDKVEFSFLDDAANPLVLEYRIGIDRIKPLAPAEVDTCAYLKKENGGVLPPSGGLHCDKPKGGDRDVVRATKIAFKCAAPSPAGNVPSGGGSSNLEAALANQQKVDLYTIYFSFDSDAIREESTPALAELADILTRHADWRLAVNGHTDGIGIDQYNTDLSKRRAASVVNALVTQYHIDAGRLKSAGFGKSQPKDTNDTLEGRARNRRVELVRF